MRTLSRHSRQGLLAWRQLPFFLCGFFLLVSVLIPWSTHASERKSLIQAIKTKQTHDVEAMIKSGADVNDRDSNDYTVLMLAIAHLRNTDISMAILEAGANVNATTKEGETALSMAVDTGQSDVVEILLRSGAKAKDTGSLSPTMLCTAAMDDNVVILRDLIEAGLNKDAKDFYSGETPLICAARKGAKNAVLLLIEAGCDVNAEDNRGWTALMWATEEKQLEIIRLLRKAQSDDLGLRTASLFEAIRRDHAEEAHAQIKKGADLNSRNTLGQTALIVAIDNNCTEIAKTLIQAGADVNLNSDSGWSPLSHVARHGNLQIARALIQAGADVQSKDPAGATALSEASVHGYLDLVRALVAVGADINAADKRGVSVLMQAAFGGQPQVVRYLISLGANVQLRDHQGLTALEYAKLSGNGEVVQILREAGQ